MNFNLTVLTELFIRYFIWVVALVLFLTVWRQRLGLSSVAKRIAADERLIQQAIRECGDSEAKETYLTITVGQELQYLTAEYSRASLLRLMLGSIYLVTGFVSIGITGTDASIPGFLNTVKLSFAVNIVGEIASGFLIFGNFVADAALDKRLAKELRIEVAQFIAQSSEYAGQDADRRWYLLTESVEKLLCDSFVELTVTEKPKDSENP